MLFLALKNRKMITIEPKEALDPSMTVADLFRDGPTCIQILDVKGVAKRIQDGVTSAMHQFMDKL